MLLANGADVNARDRNGNTPLHKAQGIDSQEFYRSIVSLLLTHNADITLKNADGDTPLHVAARRCRNYGGPFLQDNFHISFEI